MPPRPILAMTRQRRVILEQLSSTRSHPTADEVYEMVRAVLPRISLGTVYRNLEIMASAGMIRKLHTSGPQRRFDADATPHHHVRCERCGRVSDVDVDPGLDPLSALLDPSGYDISGCRVEFVGTCPVCRAQERARGKE